MLNMENAEEVMQILERFTRLKQKEIPKELDDYMHYVAKTGDTVFKWSSLKYLFREKLLNVIKNFHDTSPRVDGKFFVIRYAFFLFLLDFSPIQFPEVVADMFK